MPTAVCTLKHLGRPTANMQTLVASPTGVLRRHGNHFNPCLDSLVFKEESKLMKRPTVGASTLCFTPGLSVGSVAYTSQVLNCNNRTLGLGLVNNSSTDIVVKPRLKPLLFPRQPFQQLTTSTPTATCAFRGAFLNRGENVGKFVSNRLYRFTIPFISGRGNGDTPATKINTDNIAGLDWVWSFIRQLNVDVIESIISHVTLLGSLYRAVAFIHRLK